MVTWLRLRSAVRHPHGPHSGDYWGADLRGLRFSGGHTGLTRRSEEGHMTHSLRGGQRPERNPLEFALCAFLFYGLTPIMLGLEPLPGSLAKVPTPFGQLSAALIVLGAFGVMVGILWRGRDIGLL